MNVSRTHFSLLPAAAHSKQDGGHLSQGHSGDLGDAGREAEYYARDIAGRGVETQPFFYGPRETIETAVRTLFVPRIETNTESFVSLDVLGIKTCGAKRLFLSNLLFARRVSRRDVCRRAARRTRLGRRAG